MLLGYWLGTYGLSQLRSCNAGLVDLLVPGRSPKCNPDAPTGGKGPPLNNAPPKGGIAGINKRSGFTKANPPESAINKNTHGRF